MPGRTIGFSLMTLIIVFVAIWMNQQQGTSTSDPAAPAGELPELVGFRSDAWLLPDDALLGFVEIPAGSFIMGSNPGLDRMAYQNERWSELRRQGSVDLPRFFISRFETTIAQYRAFVADTGAGAAVIDPLAPAALPVTQVTWPEALAYGRWLERQLLQSPQTPAPLREFLQAGAHVTLPTEAEWEKAARGSDGRIWPWGSQPSEQYANFNGNALRSVGAVACLPCSFGLSDMAGNVWELTRSPLQDYPYDPADDADDLAADPLWVMRGGGYSDGLANIRSAVRGGVDPGVRSPSIGFRLVISTL